MTTTEWSQADIARVVGEVLRSRRAVRAFKPEPVPQHVVQEIVA